MQGGSEVVELGGREVERGEDCRYFFAGAGWVGQEGVSLGEGFGVGGSVG